MGISLFERKAQIIIICTYYICNALRNVSFVCIFRIHISQGEKILLLIAARHILLGHATWARYYYYLRLIIITQIIIIFSSVPAAVRRRFARNAAHVAVRDALQAVGGPAVLLMECSSCIVLTRDQQCCSIYKYFCETWCRTCRRNTRACCPGGTA